ncbi:MAG: ribonuclease HII [Pseudomonadota bacterium]
MLYGTPKTGFGALDLSEKGAVIGVDEAGRGPLAGPVVAGAVVLCKSPPAGLADSKVLSSKKRAKLDLEIRASCAWAVGVIEPAQIDEINILQATFQAMTDAVERLSTALDCAVGEVIIDGNMTPAGRRDGWHWPARAIVGGDGIEPAISAASIVAKEWRDRIMIEAAKAHPHYGWERNKGYGSREHMEALRIHGPTRLHRQSFAPVAQASLL